MTASTAASKWTAKIIAGEIARQTFEKKCLVLVNNCNWTGFEADVLGVTNDLRLIDVEIKISRSDLKADAKKDKWWQRTFLGWGEGKEVYSEDGRLIRVVHPRLYDTEPLTHPRKVWKHYYALPAAIWKPELLDSLPSKASGVLLLSEPQVLGHAVGVTCVRRATPQRDAYVLSPAEVMAIARLANLRMWDAYRQAEIARRDANHWRVQATTIAEGV